jgi:hypothetical protein
MKAARKMIAKMKKSPRVQAGVDKKKAANPALGNPIQKKKSPVRIRLKKNSVQLVNLPGYFYLYPQKTQSSEELNCASSISIHTASDSCYLQRTKSELNPFK